jgi:hypothetical protein
MVTVAECDPPMGCSGSTWAIPHVWETLRLYAGYRVAFSSIVYYPSLLIRVGGTFFDYRFKRANRQRHYSRHQ